jgi:hypothetical protein
MLVYWEWCRPYEPRRNLRFVVCVIEPKRKLSTPTLSTVMSAKAQVPFSANDLRKNSSLDRGFESQPEQNLNPQPQEFDQVGQDVDFDRALAGWIIKQRSKWRESRQPEAWLDGNAIP